MNKRQEKSIIKAGFSIPDIDTLSLVENINGVIMKDGTLIMCAGFNEHRYLYPFLHNLGLVDSPEWTDDKSAMHITSNQLCGTVAYSMENPVLKDKPIPEKQLQTLFRLRKILDGTYGDNTKVGKLLYDNHCSTINHGGKFNGLSFLKKYYTHINVPLIDKNYSNLKQLVNGICLRTSPEKSLPGLLTSKFDMFDHDVVKRSIKEIKSDFSKYSSIVEYNKLHYFFQEQLEGANGVCHVRGREKKFTYSVSENRGDIVAGKKGSYKLNHTILSELKTIAFELFEDFGLSIQLEFVVSNAVLYIVQLRVLKNEPEETVRLIVPSKAITFGKTFSHGKIEVDVKDIAVVSKDGESSELLGKKALIVTSNVEFSHLLALSKTLGIPSMYGTGKIDFKRTKKVKFVAYNKKSWILKLK